MKILYVSGHPHLRTDAPSGYATHMRETMRALRCRGVEVVPWIVGDQRATPAEGSREAKPGGSRGVLRRVVPGALWQGMRDASLMRHDRAAEAPLVEAIERERPDVVYERASYLFSAGVRAAHRTGVPLVVEINAPYVEERTALHGRGMLDGYGDRWERTVLQGAALVVTVSTVLGSYLRERGGLDASSVRVLPNAVDPELFHPGVPTCRPELGIADDAFVIGYVGSFIAWHRLDVLVRATALLRRAGVPAVALLVGDGPTRAELLELAADLGVGDHVVAPGAVPFERVPGHVQSADVCAIPDHAWYCSPIKLFEYGGLRKAVVAKESAPILEVVEDGRDCLLFPGSPEGLAAALRALHDDPRRRAALADSLHARVCEQHTWSASARRLVDWLSDLRGRGA